MFPDQRRLQMCYLGLILLSYRTQCEYNFSVICDILQIWYQPGNIARWTDLEVGVAFHI
jgi:hypothetical protein